MNKITPSIANAIFRSDFHAFARKAFGVLNTTAVWSDNWHLEAISYQLERIRLGLCKRLIITLPPRSLKSHLGSVAFPAFMLGQDPTKKIVCVSYSQELAAKHAGDFRRLIESVCYQQLFPNFCLSRNTASEIETKEGGFRLTTSTEGTLTGRGGDLIILDDPMNANDGYSEISRKTLKEWFATTLASRLDNPSTGAIVVIMQRLHEDDLVGHLQQLGGWEVLNLPAIAQDSIDVPLSDNMFFSWKKGDLLHPNRLPLSELGRLKQSMGADIFNAQYLQAPVPETGNSLKRDWLRYYDSLPAPSSDDLIVQSWDTAMKAGVNNDYSVCLTFRVRNKNEYYLIDVFRKRLEYPDLLKEAVKHSQKLRADVVLVEEQASGIPFLQGARRMGVQGVIGIKAVGDKDTRMRSATPKLESGSLFLSRSASWMDDFLHEYLAFPRGKHDDQMDALSQFLNWRANQEDSTFECDFGFDQTESAPTTEDVMLGLLRRY